MESIEDFFRYIINSESIIRTGGLAFIMLIIFAETGLFIGFFLPGDYMLFLSGLLCASGDFPISLFILVPAVILAAFLGNTVGYYTGKYLGPRLFKKDDSFLFKKKYLERTRTFFQKRGNTTLVLARFLPIIRTFAPILAGAINMPFKKFSFYNLVGAICWIGLLIPSGYFLGVRFPWLINYIEYIILGFIAVTILPFIFAYIKSRIKS